MMSRRQFLSLLPAGLVAGCSEEAPQRKLTFPKVPWRVTATTQFAADMAGAIGGKAVQAQCFFPAGVIPEKFVPGAPDIARLHTSDIVLTHGLGLEQRWPVDFVEMAGAGVRVFTATSTIPPDRIIHPSGPGGPPDCHVWTHPELAACMVDAIAGALKEAMPKLSDYFGPRAYQLRLRLEEIMKAATQRAKELKPDGRFLLTSHDSMQYFAAAFSLEARALTSADGTIADRIPDSLKDWIATHKVKSLFREPSAEMDLLRRMLYEVKVDPDHPIHSLTLPEKNATTITPYKVYETGTTAGCLQHLCESVLSTLIAN
ncbi:MAG TPA: metal ABC transporter substrate-binding protein [Verrucomicrobiales bacterium]|jgi:ABC-type Zn uptake system ZnuABC Zn-binding protein ZnuA|nr:metal ABC transporter substrate-binding protein [Verrucomicrobiales bacterium]